MRFITFLGLTMIAKCIDGNAIADAAGFVLLILLIALIVDIIEWRKRYGE